MQTDDRSPDLLVPPKRLGTLLAEARLAGGLSLDEAADALGGSWSSLALLEVETGRRPVLDDDLVELARLYGIRTTNLVPERSHLVIDLNEGTLDVGSQRASLGASAERREVLLQYLTLVYATRDLPVGTPVPLRDPDLEVLAESLSVSPEVVGDDLRALMQGSAELFEPRVRRLRQRVLIPAIGIVVAGTAVGVLLWMSNDGEGSTVTTRDGANAPAQVEPEIGDAVTQERLPDGTPGPVEVRD